ncbi:hypothetical protein [Mumia zhuanghuii]|uniref:Uncharacterized protein n=1 Tax=Mumia zhuanghuii TaxID=2585211 RepID=A0A5C4MFC8_9ACTN|nr:hypothetical protein [Mumia zhuanghuii]TNC42458.1 hypothetical protein FHE65_21330 [Mumia zhuanghuii]TNC43695.1 hypothetical protein FHE65_17820 [Mumia zhuanghuii]
MEQAGPDWHGFGERPGRPYRAFVLIVLGIAAVLVITGAVLQLTPDDDSDEVVPPLRPQTPLGETHSVSIDFGVVTDPETDWDKVSAQLADAGATAVNLSAGRVEFTAFDWSEHPEAAAEEGTDHLAEAARGLYESPDGQERTVNLIVDAFVPRWIESDPSVAGTSVDGTRGTHGASASQLAEGEVGDRLIDYVTELGERYNPASIEVTELFFSGYTYGADDLALFTKMTGAQDWPRTGDGAIDTSSTAIARWRTEVIAGVLDRMRDALDDVRDGDGREIGLTLDVRVDWGAPSTGSPTSGHDYALLMSSVRGLRLQLWAYIGLPPRAPSAVEGLTAALQRAGYDMERFILSIGVWTTGRTADGARAIIAPQTFEVAVRDAATHGITDVNVTPYSLLSAEYWQVLASVWGDQEGRR